MSEQTDNKINIDFLKDTSSFCKILVIVLNLLAFISCSIASTKCISCTAHSTIFLFVSMIAFWISLFILAINLFKFYERFKTISFDHFGFYFDCVISLAYFGSSLIIIFLGGFFAASGFFGLLATAVYIIDAYFYYCKINDRQPYPFVKKVAENGKRKELTTNQMT